MIEGDTLSYASSKNLSQAPLIGESEQDWKFSEGKH